MTPTPLHESISSPALLRAAADEIEMLRAYCDQLVVEKCALVDHQRVAHAADAIREGITPEKACDTAHLCGDEDAYEILSAWLEGTAA